MKQSILILTTATIVGLLLGSWYMDSNPTWTESSYVADVLHDLGESKSHYIEQASKENIAMGEDLILKGQTVKDGRRTRKISKFYECTSCHNTVREDPDLKTVDPAARLSYAVENKIPYLQGSTFWGIINRDTWYNDDYVKKYGNLVEKAKNSVEESIQLCAQVCAQGRELEKWEIDVMLAYFKSISMKISDLNLDEKEWYSIQHGKITNEEKIKKIKSNYLTKSPATFLDPPENKGKGYGLEGNSTVGKQIYEISCKHCHRVNGESDVILDDDRLTFKWLKKNIKKHSQLSLYEIIRHGTYSELGHKEYMPLYTKEKMSDQQIEDLRAYIEEMAKGKKSKN